MREFEIDPNLAVEDVMCRWPATIAVFVRRRMSCFGCAFGPFHSIADSCAEYGIPLAELMEELEAAAFERTS
jgi:hybrid cluster-associated redox disulfide protein